MHAPQLPHQRIFRSTFGAKDPAAPRVNVVNVFHSVAMARRAFPTRPPARVAFNDHQLQKWRASELLRCLCAPCCVQAARSFEAPCTPCVIELMPASCRK
jgi:hypothetical protein